MKENAQEKSPIKQKILLYLDFKGVTPYEFYKISGVTRGILTQSNGINEDNLAKFLAYAQDINPGWLLTGEGPMIRETPKPVVMTTTERKLVLTANHSEDAVGTFTETYKKTPGAIPLVSERAVGGFANEHFTISEHDVLAYYIIPKFRNLGVDFMIEVIGDSMIPKFYPGDIIACSIVSHSKFIQWNKPYLLATRDQGLIVKRLRKSDEKNCLLAVSDNHDYDPFDIPIDEIVGMARVIGVIHLE